MKLSQEQIFQLVKKNFPYILMILIIIALMVFGGISQQNIAVWKKQVDLKELQFQQLQKVRDSLEIENKNLIADLQTADKERDSLIEVKIVLQKQMEWLEWKHKKDIDSLINVPDDTAFVRLQPIYPNSDLSPLQYRFSGSQVRQIYSVALYYPRLQSEYTLQGSLLSNSNSLNTKYATSLKNYESRVNNLNLSLLYCDDQIKIREEHLVIKDKQLRNKSIWNWIFKGTTIIFATYSAIK